MTKKESHARNRPAEKPESPRLDEEEKGRVLDEALAFLDEREEAPEPETPDEEVISRLD